MRQNLVVRRGEHREALRELTAHPEALRALTGEQEPQPGRARLTDHHARPATPLREHRQRLAELGGVRGDNGRAMLQRCPGRRQ
ncbi:hypothetical protein GCM10010434_086820 [Winogradskya humida]